MSHSRRQPLLIVALVAGAAFALWWIGGRSTAVPPRIGHDQAVAIAEDFFASADAHGTGTTVSNVVVSAADLASDAGGRAAWRINIRGEVTEAGKSALAYGSVMWLSVDAESGAVTVLAQG